MTRNLLIFGADAEYTTGKAKKVRLIPAKAADVNISELFQRATGYVPRRNIS